MSGAFNCYANKRNHLFLELFPTYISRFLETKRRLRDITTTVNDKQLFCWLFVCTCTCNTYIILLVTLLTFIQGPYQTTFLLVQTPGRVDCGSTAYEQSLPPSDDNVSFICHLISLLWLGHVPVHGAFLSVNTVVVVHLKRTMKKLKFYELHLMAAVPCCFQLVGSSLHRFSKSCTK